RRLRGARRRRAAGGRPAAADARRLGAAHRDARDLPDGRDARRTGCLPRPLALCRRRHDGAATCDARRDTRGRPEPTAEGRPGLMRALVGLIILAAAGAARSQEGVFLTEAEAPRAVFRDADAFTRDDVVVTPERRAQVTAGLGGVLPSVWEERWIVFRAVRAGTPLGRAIVVEEIGKHRPITFVVGLRPDRTVEDVAVMAYREAY